MSSSLLSSKPTNNGHVITTVNHNCITVCHIVIFFMSYPMCMTPIPWQNVKFASKYYFFNVLQYEILYHSSGASPQFKQKIINNERTTHTSMPLVSCAHTCTMQHHEAASHDIICVNINNLMRHACLFHLGLVWQK